MPPTECGAWRRTGTCECGQGVRAWAREMKGGSQEVKGSLNIQIPYVIHKGRHLSGGTCYMRTLLLLL